MQTLLVFAHTFWENSKANRTLLDSATNLDNVKIHNLSTAYPNGNIDVEFEMKLLQQSGKIIFQFPLFWFSTPALLKEWQDRVLTAILYGDNPKMLEGKTFQIITIAGGNAKSYDGHHGYSLETLLSPLKSAFEYSRCKVLEPYCIFSVDVKNLPLQEYLAEVARVR
ncbi:NAD(P)H-dependent oxidoreductase [Campylobacter helveticus]|uniref:NAD(P)H-dependent oxidoreductase n=1 Tax=Campylobacter helveticus TaxID=28898 RepID=UPI002149F476|nr:NAD(P)H-dependent oxidoreductase [Campylobacter helveticus]MCR2056758.1 NAD(P)H-dependent oxidoreductase [Campylobacter helveticus]